MILLKKIKNVKWTEHQKITGENMKVVILGKGEMLSNLIEGTLDAGCEIAGVFRYERTVTSSFVLAIKDFFKTAHDLTLIKRHKLYEIKCKSANCEKFKKEILKLNADVLVTGTWGEKLKKNIIDLPVIAAVNVHPSFLPKYRGPNPYLQTILHQEKQSGLTFHLINEEFDSGAILSQKKIDILPGDTSKELKDRTVFQARLLWSELLKKLEYGLIIPVKQNEKDAVYYKNINPEDMMLDFEKETAEEVSARIRAFHPWMPCYISYKKDYFIPNPYKIKILNECQTEHILNKRNLRNVKPGVIIDKNSKAKSITVMCSNSKSIKFTRIKIYGILKSKFTGLFIKYGIK